MSDIATRRDIERALPRSNPLTWFRPGRTVRVNDKMQRGYEYGLEAPAGALKTPRTSYNGDFNPAVTPQQMLRRGVFEGKYLNDGVLEFPREWFQGRGGEGVNPRLSPEGPDPALNEFGVKSRKSLKYWIEKGWIPITRHSTARGALKRAGLSEDEAAAALEAAPDPDVRGWFQWYCRYWVGRRDPVLDPIQIARWRSFRRHAAQVEASYDRLRAKGKPVPRTREEKRGHRAVQRQGLLQWAYDPYV